MKKRLKFSQQKNETSLEEGCFSSSDCKILEEQAPGHTRRRRDAGKDVFGSDIGCHEEADQPNMIIVTCTCIFFKSEYSFQIAFQCIY